MLDNTIGFVGGGRITSIILHALGGKTLDPARTVVSDPDPAVRTALAAQYPGITVVADNATAATQEIVFLALHPPAMKTVLPELASFVRPTAIVVSLAPVLRLASMASLLGGHARVARVLPNAPSLIGAGFNPVAFGPDFDADDRIALDTLLDGLGAHPEVPESTIEAYAILAAMGPTYFWFQWQALRELAAQFGLTPDEGDRTLRAMLDGAVRTFFDSGLSPEQVMDLVPVKPLATSEPVIRQIYQDTLTRLHAKLTGV